MRVYFVHEKQVRLRYDDEDVPGGDQEDQGADQVMQECGKTSPLCDVIGGLGEVSDMLVG